jgi:hypothetical protein
MITASLNLDLERFYDFPADMCAEVSGRTACYFDEFITAPGTIRFTVPIKWAVSALASGSTNQRGGVT